MRNREQGKLIVGKDYVCFLLYSEDGGDDETTWMKLTTDNRLRITCLGMPATTSSEARIRVPGIAESEGFASSLVTVSIQSPTPSKS